MHSLFKIGPIGVDLPTTTFITGGVGCSKGALAKGRASIARATVLGRVSATPSTRLFRTKYQFARRKSVLLISPSSVIQWLVVIQDGASADEYRAVFLHAIAVIQISKPEHFTVACVQIARSQHA